ncbi:hypothetical protein Tco_1493884 [Tanacetum coccineum]
MTTTTAQQFALDNDLVPLEKGLEIGKYNTRIDPSKTQKEPTYQIVLDVVALTTCYLAFLISTDVLEIYMHQFWFTINKKDYTSYRFKIDKKSYRIDMEVFREIFQICPRLSNQDFDELLSDEEIVSFIKELGHKGDIKSITEVVVDHMYQPWRTFAVIINKCLSRKITASRKMKRKLKKPASLSKKRTLVTVEEEEPEPAKKVVPTKKPTTKRQSFGVQIRDTPNVSVSKKKAPTKIARSKGTELLSDAALLEEAQLKKALKRSKRETTIHQAGGSSEGADSKSEVPDEQKGKSIDTSEGTGLKPGVSDVSKGDSSKREYESWGDSGDEDADDQQGDDERTESNDKPTKTDNPKINDDEEEIQDDEFVHTHDDYVPTDDKSKDVIEEEYERINEELYGDVNVSLTDVEPANKEKDDVEMIVAGHVNVNQEGAGNQVKDDAQATQKTNAPILSSFISSDYAAKFLNFDNIPLTDTEVVSMIDINVQHEVPRTSSLLTILVSVIPEQDVINQSTTSTTVVSESETLAALQLRVTDLEKDVKELKDVDNSTKVIKKNVAGIIKEHSVLGETVERLRQQYAPQKSVEDIREIKKAHARKKQVPKETITSFDTTTIVEFDQKTTLFKIMTKSKSFKKSPKQRDLYHALMESILEDEDAMDEGFADKLKKKKQDDADKDEGPFVGSDRGLKRRKTSKDTEQSKKAKLTETSKGTSKSQPKSTTNSVQEGETVFVAGDTQGPQNLGEHTIKNKPTQKWHSDLAKAEKPSRTFNDLMSTPIDFSAFVMNRLKISELTRDILVGPAYNILKGTCRSYVELDYYIEECYKVLTDQLDWNNPEGDRYPFELSKPLPLVMSRNHRIVPVDYFFNNDLAYLLGGSTGKTYMTLLTKTKAAKYDLLGIEYMVPNLWSPVKVAYDNHALLGTSHWAVIQVYGRRLPRLHLHDIEDMLILLVQNRLFNLKGNVIVHLAAALCMFTRRIVIQKRVEDLQLSVESYKKKLNISRPMMHKARITDLKPYSAYSNPQGFIYVDKLGRNIRMCSHEFYKFSDGTLISLRDTLKDMANNLEMGYTSVMPRRRWSSLDKKRSHIIIKDIDRQLLNRRLMRSLEKFIGGREYEEDLRLLQWTI